jgi:hypothetical protein
MSETKPIPPAPTNSFGRHQTQRVKQHLASTLYNLFGVVLCLVAALICAKLFVQSPSARYVHAWLRGRPANYWRTLPGYRERSGGNGIDFNLRIFPLPATRHFHVTDDSARASLLWMLLCALVIPNLLFPRTTQPAADDCLSACSNGTKIFPISKEPTMCTEMQRHWGGQPNECQPVVSEKEVYNEPAA